MELELKYLAPYLPYGLKVRHNGHVWKIAGYDIGIILNRNVNSGKLEGNTKLRERATWEIKPILRPLSDLTKEIEHNGEKFVPFYELNKVDEEYFISIEDGETIYFEDFCEINIYEVTRCYSLIQKLLEWHFDVFGLIEAGLAIDINTITK